MSDVWFTADTHLGHANILKYTNRPFDSIEEHDEAYIENHNARVKPGDRVYHNGDLSFHRPNRTAQILRRLNGQIFVQKGNHDPEDLLKELQAKELIVNWRDIRELKVDGQFIVLCHFPLLTWNRGHYGSWMLHGHCHGNAPDTGNKRLDVGVDVWDHAPVSFEQIREEMKARNYEAVDHHEGSKR